MLVVRCKNPNSAEREFIDAIADLDGVAFIGYTVAQGAQEREIDALVFTPVRAVAVEVKAPQMATPRAGELIPYPNAPWTIAGSIAQFYGGSNPLNQARTGAKIFATYLRERMDKTPFVQVAVAVTDADLIMSSGPVLVGMNAVTLISQVSEGLELMQKRSIPLQMALEIIEIMNLGVLRPSREEIEREWGNAEELQAAAPAPLSETERAKRKQSKAPFFQSMEDFTAAFKKAIVAFLFLWFLYTLGVLGATIHVFDALQSLVSEALTGQSNQPVVPPRAQELINETSTEDASSNPTPTEARK